jgi:hypothetical protein
LIWHARESLRNLVSGFVAREVSKLYRDVLVQAVYPVPAANPLTEDEHIAIPGEEADTPANAIVTTQAGRMQPRKGQQVLIEPVAALRHVPNCECWQIGGLKLRKRRGTSKPEGIRLCDANRLAGFTF